VTPPMSHAASFFAAALLLWAWLRNEGNPRGGFVVGLLGGLVASVRWQDVLLLAAPLSWPFWPGRRRHVPPRRAAAWGGAILAGFALAFLPQLCVWRILNGSVTPFGVISLSGRFRFTAPYLLGVLFSPFHGLLLWTPILLPAFLGLGALAVTDDRGKALALAVVLELYMISGYAVAFGQSFGQRLFISSLPIAAVGLAVFGERMAPRLPRALVIAGGAAAVWWNTSLMVQYATGMIPRNEGVSLGRLLENQLVGVPRRLPDVIGRYLFDRRSLYHVDPSRLPADDHGREP